MDSKQQNNFYQPNFEQYSQQPPPYSFHQHQQQPSYYIPVQTPSLINTPIIVNNLPTQVVGPPAVVEGKLNINYLKSGSAVTRIILSIILFIACILMGNVDYLDYYKDLTNYYYQELIVYFDTLSSLRQSYLACSSLLFIIQIIKITLNLFNYGDYTNTSPRDCTKVVNIIIAVIETLVFIGFAAIFFSLSYYGFFLYIDPNFATAMVFVIVSSIIRSIVACADGCCGRRNNVPVSRPPQVIILRQ